VPQHRHRFGLDKGINHRTQQRIFLLVTFCKANTRIFFIPNHEKHTERRRINMTTAIDPAFSAVGKEVGLEIWRIEKLLPIPVPKETYGKFFTGDSYIVLNTYKKNPKSNTLNYDIHYWLGKYFALNLSRNRL
jgi:hypothetical protein